MMMDASVSSETYHIVSFIFFL